MVVDGDVRSFAGESNSGAAAHATVATGYQGLAALEATAAFITCLAMIRLGIHLACEARPGLRLLLERWLGILAERILHGLCRPLRKGSVGLPTPTPPTTCRREKRSQSGGKRIIMRHSCLLPCPGQPSSHASRPSGRTVPDERWRPAFCSSNRRSPALRHFSWRRSRAWLLTPDRPSCRCR